MMATTVMELGTVYCSIVSYANVREHQGEERVEILQKLLAIRSKLKRSHVMKTNIVYEVRDTISIMVVGSSCCVQT